MTGRLYLGDLGYVAHDLGNIVHRLVDVAYNFFGSLVKVNATMVVTFTLTNNIFEIGHCTRSRTVVDYLHSMAAEH